MARYVIPFLALLWLGLAACGQGQKHAENTPDEAAADPLAELDALFVPCEDLVGLLMGHSCAGADSLGGEAAAARTRQLGELVLARSGQDAALRHYDTEDFLRLAFEPWEGSPLMQGYRTRWEGLRLYTFARGYLDPPMMGEERVLLVFDAGGKFLSASVIANKAEGEYEHDGTQVARVLSTADELILPLFRYAGPLDDSPNSDFGTYYLRKDGLMRYEAAE